MIYLVLSILFMTALALGLRVSAGKADPLAVTSISRIMSGAVITSWLLWSASWADIVRLWPIAWPHIAVGASCFWLAGFASIKAVNAGPLGITWTTVRLSMVIPTLASIFYWLEVPVSLNALFVVRMSGLAIAVAAVVCIGLDRAKATPSIGVSSQPILPWLMWLGAAVLTQGGWEIVLRASKSLPDDQARAFFVSGVFAGSMLLSFPILAICRPRMAACELKFGGLIAVFSLLASGLRPWALKTIDGAIVFPVTAITVTLLVLAAGRVVWKEKLGNWGLIGAASAIISILLLTLRLG